MIRGNTFTVPFRRKRQGRTYYKKRLRILLSNKHRFVVRKSLKNLYASLIEYNPKGDKVIFTVDTNALNKLGWKSYNGNIPSAYLTGFMAGKKAVAKGIQEAILDLGFNTSVKGSRLYAALAGALDAGLKIPHEPEMLPPKDRISGEHIVKYANSLSSNKAQYEKQFSSYIKKGLAPEELAKHFHELKGKLNG